MNFFPMAGQFGLGILPWSPLASGLLTGKYLQKENSQDPINASQGRQLLVNAQHSADWKTAVVEEVVKISKEVNKTPAQVALNWVVQQPLVTSTIIGARTVAQLEDNLGALSFSLSKEQIDRLTKISQPAPIFPHAFLQGPSLRAMATAGCQIENRSKY